MFAHVTAENMHDHIRDVQNHPLRAGQPFDAQRLDLPLRQRPVDLIGDGTYLTVGVGRTDDEVIGDRGERGDVEDENVVGLFGEGCLSDGECFRLGLRNDWPPPNDTSCGRLYRIRRPWATAPRRSIPP